MQEVVQTGNNKSQKRFGLPCTCTASLILIAILFFAPIIFNSVNVFLNQIKWWNSGLDDYNIILLYAGPGGQPPQILTVQDGKIINSVIRVVKDGEVTDYPGFPMLNLTVTDLFNQAFGCFLYTFCRVEYDPNYGFPKQLGGGFLEPSWIEVVNFEPEIH